LRAALPWERNPFSNPSPLQRATDVSRRRTFSIPTNRIIIRAMKKRAAAFKGPTNTEKDPPRQPSRDHAASLRRTFQGKGLMKALLAEKKREREL